MGDGVVGIDPVVGAGAGVDDRLGQARDLVEELVVGLDSDRVGVDQAQGYHIGRPAQISLPVRTRTGVAG